MSTMMQFEKWTGFRNGGLADNSDGGTYVGQLWFDETFFDVSLPGLVVSHTALCLFAGEL